LGSCLFATCFYGLLNIRTFQLDYSRAGHPYPILIRQKEPIQLESRGGLLGVFPNADFEQKSLQLLPGDKLFVFSDGGESLIGKNDENGQFRFHEQFQKICSYSIDDMIDSYKEMAVQYKFKPAEIDDITALGMEII
jgi:serine phosphatase RsbU (regulator of sigma subunit)